MALAPVSQVLALQTCTDGADMQASFKKKNPKVGKLNYINWGQERSKIETKANNRLVVPCG